MSLKVVEPGLLATIQDLGRFGTQKYGIIVSGAMDTISLRIANLLIGNNEKEAGIEVTYYKTSFVFEQDHIIAITGGNLQPTIDNVYAPMWRPLLIKKGSTLKFNRAISGCRAYLAIAGGVSVPEELGSKSTYTRAGIGGYKGRALQKDDTLKIGCLSRTNQLFFKQLKSASPNVSWHVDYSTLFTFQKKEKIRVLKGNEFEHFNKETQQAFMTKTFTLTTQADRMGYKFEGPTLERTDSSEVLSAGVTYGTIQVPSNGQPIILMADRQTTGGYPKIGQVISADLPKLAQLQPTNKVNFESISIDQAEEELLYVEEIIKEIRLAIYLKAKTGGISQ